MRRAERRHGRYTIAAATPATSDARGDVEPEVVAGRHHREPDPRRPGEPEHLRPRAARTTVAITTLTISASSACRLGIAAYGFDEKATNVDEWLTVECAASVSVKPASGNIRGGAVGRST